MEHQAFRVAVAVRPESAPKRRVISFASRPISAGRRAGLWIACAAISGLAMLAFAGCTGDVNPQSTITQSNGYVEPAWMAVQRQEQEEDALAMHTCMTEAGWEETLNPDYTGSGPTLTQVQAEAHLEAVTKCLDLVYGDDDVPVEDAAFWRVKYARALDTAACLTAAGYTISEPPSEDVWVDALLTSGYSIWTPFDSVINQAGLDMATYYALFNQCPQNGPTSVMRK